MDVVHCFTGGDLFIPEALDGSKEEKRAYDNWVENKLIPALDEQGIRFVRSWVVELNKLNKI